MFVYLKYPTRITKLRTKTSEITDDEKQTDFKNLFSLVFWLDFNRCFSAERVFQMRSCTETKGEMFSKINFRRDFSYIRPTFNSVIRVLGKCEGRFRLHHAFFVGGIFEFLFFFVN